VVELKAMNARHAALTDQQKRVLWIRFGTVKMFVSSALEDLLNSWTEQISPSFLKKGQSLSSLIAEIDGADAAHDIPDDLFLEDQATNETTEEMLRNLYCVAAFHILEQQMVARLYPINKLIEKELRKKTPNLKRRPIVHLNHVPEAVRQEWGIDIEKMNSWQAVDELRMIQTV
jgi:hypothetical protein